MTMMRGVAAFSFVCAAAGFAHAGDLCDGKKPGTVSFYTQEISRDAPLPKAVDTFEASQSTLFALLCLSKAAGPQESGGKKFRIVLYVDGRQQGLLRPQLSKPRKDVILAISEDFDSQLKELGDGSHELRFQAASEQENGKTDIDVNLDSGKVTKQKLRDASYLADGKITITK